jgi:cytochrome oxidase Cu insertion factor (SCO1/SenC/PrrC family)
MKLLVRTFLITLALAGCLAVIPASPAQQRQDGNLQIGNPAPDFTVQDIAGKSSVQLSKLRGKPVVLIFGSCT